MVAVPGTEATPSGPPASPREVRAAAAVGIALALRDQEIGREGGVFLGPCERDRQKRPEDQDDGCDEAQRVWTGRPDFETTGSVHGQQISNGVLAVDVTRFRLS